MDDGWMRHVILSSYLVHYFNAIHIYIYTHIFAVYLHLYVYFRSTPHPVTVTTRIITYLVGNPYKPSFATVTGWGVDPMYIYIYTQNTCFCHVLLK